ncbi:hypothetical protein [Epilithonimonas vandammei]|uniref:hypothetical protein n=1 Tax=Epilithonimonas vandammei TaxID=2487072 RepID=UPI0028A5B165|nr:hypothetical protein [Epilithonimonas vandammei]
MSNENNFQEIDISKITQWDLFKIYPNCSPLLLSTIDENSDDKFRVLEILQYSKHYKISELTKIITEYYKNIYPDIF